MFAVGAAAGFTGGVVGTKLHGGSWSDALKSGVKGAITGAITAGMAHGMAELAGSHTASFFNSGAKGFGTALFKAVAQGVGRMAIARAQGQRGKAAFWSGFAGSGFSVGTSMFGKGPSGFMLRTTLSGVISGTVSEQTGGKFANGAVAGAFQHMFNDENWAQEFGSPKVAYSSENILIKQKDGIYDSGSPYNEKRLNTVKTLDKVANTGAVISLVGKAKKNPLTMKIGAGISTGATTLKILIDPKPYQPYEIYNEYVNLWLTVTPAY